MAENKDLVNNLSVENIVGNKECTPIFVHSSCFNPVTAQNWVQSEINLFPDFRTDCTDVFLCVKYMIKTLGS